MTRWLLCGALLLLFGWTAAHAGSYVCTTPTPDQEAQLSAVAQEEGLTKAALAQSLFLDALARRARDLQASESDRIQQGLRALSPEERKTKQREIEVLLGIPERGGRP